MSSEILKNKSWLKMLKHSIHAQEMDKTFRQAHQELEDLQQKLKALDSGCRLHLNEQIKTAHMRKVFKKQEIEKMIRIYENDPISWMEEGIKIKDIDILNEGDIDTLEEEDTANIRAA